MKDKPIDGTWKATWGIRSQYGKEEQWVVQFDTHHQGIVSVGLSELDGLVDHSTAAATATLFAASKELLEVARLWENASQAREYIPERERASWDTIMAATRAAIMKATTVDRSVAY